MSFGKFNQFFASWLDLDQIFSLQNKRESRRERHFVKIALSCVEIDVMHLQTDMLGYNFLWIKEMFIEFAMFI